MRKTSVILAGAVGFLFLAGSANQELQSKAGAAKEINPVAPGAVKVNTDFGKMPLYFIPNRGQADKQVSYYVQGKDKTLYFTDEGITFALSRPGLKKEMPSKPWGAGQAHVMKEDRIKSREPGLKAENAGDGRAVAGEPEPSGGAGYERWVVKLEFVGANAHVKPIAEAEAGGVVSYFKGKPEEWHAGLPTYSIILYSNLWPGIDLAYYGTVNKLKYEFIVHPGADPSKIRLAYRGAESLSVDDSGRLQLKTPAGELSDDAPAAYQDIGGHRREVRLAYKLSANGQNYETGGPDSTIGSPAKEDTASAFYSYGFEIGEYDRTQKLVLDPAVLVYCGFIGGSAYDYGSGIAVDRLGNVYVTGSTNSHEATFPVMVGPDLTHNGVVADGDAFVAKINSTGTALVYCGYIGGSRGDNGNGIAVDGAGNAYVTGYTGSTEATFPVTVGPDLTYNGSLADYYLDAFVAKVNPAGTALVYCGYIGGSMDEKGDGIAVDGSGNAYVVGNTGSSESTFPVKVGPDLTHNSSPYNYYRDAFVAKVNASGSALVYCGYVGGYYDDYGRGIAVGGSGNAYVTGYTASDESTFPETVGPDLTYNGGGYDGFVAEVNVAGTALSYCGYIGGSGIDSGDGIAVDKSGNAYVTGGTASDQATFPVISGPDLTANGTYDAFVAKVNASGTSLLYCGYIGGSDDDDGNGIAVDGSGNAYVIGETNSTEATFPAMAGPDLTQNGSRDAFVAKVNASGSALVYCGYVGGSGLDKAGGIAVDGSGHAYATGYTPSTEATFPVTVGPDLTYNGGGDDAFVAKAYSFEQPVHRHAVGDFDGDGADEFVMDFGTSGAWMWNGGAWSQLSANNPDNMIAFNIDGNGDDELAVDLGSLGLWMWNGGVWSQLGANDPEYLIAADTNDNGIDELIIDFGTGGLKWRQESGYMFGMTGMDPQNIITADTDQDGGDEVVADFGTMGIWVCDVGNWSQLTSADANTMAGLNVYGSGNFGVATGLGGLGIWLWNSGAWSQLSGAYSDRLISGKMIAGGGEEVAGDFGLMGLWLWGSGGWTQLSGVNADGTIAADTGANGTDDLAVDFELLGLWLWKAGTWIQLSGVNPEGMLAGDIDGDSAMELIVDFGSLGVWLWDGGPWSQISALNPD